jgi:hypothetical protein
MDASDKETQQYLSLIKKLDDLKVFTTKNARLRNESSCRQVHQIGKFRRVNACK